MNTKYTTKLGNLVDIRSGHPFRAKVQHTPDNWDHYVLQLKDVQKSGHIDLSQATQASLMKEKPPRPLQQGDILLRARGGYYYSGLFNANVGNVVASGQFFVLSPKSGEPGTNMVTSAYLGWYLNQPMAQQYLQKNDTGTNIPMINKKTISDLPVKLPSLNTQHKIAEIHQNWLKEKELTEQLLNNQEKMMRGLCQQYINRDLMNRDSL